MYKITTIDTNSICSKRGVTYTNAVKEDWYVMPTEEELNQMYEFYLHEDGKYRVINKH